MSQSKKIEKKPVNFSNILLGAGLNLAEYVILSFLSSTTKNTNQQISGSPLLASH